MNRIGFRGAVVVALGLVVGSGAANAASIDWTFWAEDTASSITGSVTGTAGSVGVSYTGEVENLLHNYPSWQPSPSTFSGGTIDNPPPAANGIIQLFGRSGAIDTITFAHAVTNPVLAIWSLGQSGNPATFVFSPNEPFTIESGGPAQEYGGSSIYSSAPGVVSGAEGNGTLQFNGTFTSLSWTNPQYEYWFGFTVGVPGAVPEPTTWAMMLVGFGLVGYITRKHAQRSLSYS